MAQNSLARTHSRVTLLPQPTRTFRTHENETNCAQLQPTDSKENKFQAIGQSSLVPETLTRVGGHQTELKFSDACVGQLAAEASCVSVHNVPRAPVHPSESSCEPDPLEFRPERRLFVVLYLPEHQPCKKNLYGFTAHSPLNDARRVERRLGLKLVEKTIENIGGESTISSARHPRVRRRAKGIENLVCGLYLCLSLSDSGSSFSAPCGRTGPV